MTHYRRPTLAGGTYFFTQPTYPRHPWLYRKIARLTLRAAIAQVRQKSPFAMDAIVLLPNPLR